MDYDFPQELDGWVADSEVRQYDRKTLFKYINGGAELYLAYRFRTVTVTTYSKADNPDIILDVYDMGTPEDAYGVFTAERGGSDIGIGDGAEYEAGLLRLFKGRFFVSIMTREETDQSKKAVVSLGSAVADSVQSTGQKPKLLSSLPENKLIEQSIRYFHDYNVLNLHYYLADENILLLDTKTEAVLARYSSEEGNPYLLIAKYPSKGKAERAFESFLTAYMPEAKGSSAVQTEDGTWTATELYSSLVVVVLDAPSENWARSFLEAVRSKREEKQ